MMDSVDEMLSVLVSEQRRYALYYLRQCDGPVSICELAAAITDMLGDCVPDESEQWERLLVELHHVHLPKVDRFDCVRYDPAVEMVECESPAPLLESLLDTLEGLDCSQVHNDTVSS